MRLLLVEDDEPLAGALGQSLRRSGYAVDWMADGLHADEALRLQTYDLVILDLNLPHLDGLSVLQRLRARQQHVPVLILSAREDSRDRVAGLDSGADDYLVKPFALNELEARIRALIRRSHVTLSGYQFSLGRLSLDRSARRALVAGQPLELTAREYGILEILVQRTGHLVSKQYLAEHTGEWGEEMSHTAVEVHISRLRKKLEGAMVILSTSRGFGYMLEADDAEAD